MAVSKTSKKLKPFGTGTARKFKIQIDDPDGNGIDVSGDKFYLTVKKDAETDDAGAEFQVSTVAPNDANSQAGAVFLTVLSADTSSVRPGIYDWDCMWVKTVSAPGQREPVSHGTVEFYQTVTESLT